LFYFHFYGIDKIDGAAISLFLSNGPGQELSMMTMEEKLPFPFHDEEDYN
jgi:hypothetical protein